MRARFLILGAALVLFVSVSGARAQSGDAAPTQTKGIDPALLEKANEGDAAAEFHVGSDFDDGIGVKQDQTEAAVWYRKAAAQGSAPAQYSLGCLYVFGHGVPVDISRGILLIRESADQGYTAAQSTLGSYYQRGKYVPQDYLQAASWYRKAAERGDSFSQGNLALLYESGSGVPKDRSEAYFWMDLAVAYASNFFGDAPQEWISDRDRMAAHLTKDEILKAQERARIWFAAHQAKAQ